MYEIFEHTADLGLRVIAADLNTLFAEAAGGLFSIMIENIDEVRRVEQVGFQIQGDDRQYLLFDWLRELLFTFDSKHLLLTEFQVDVSHSELKAETWGEKLDPARHRLDHEVKAITYHGLKLVERPGGWLAEVIVDI